MTYDIKKAQAEQTLCEFVDITFDWCKYVSDEYIAAGSLTLASAINDTYTGNVTVSGGNATLWSLTDGYAKIDSELMKVTIVNDTTVNITSRGELGTVAVAHAATAMRLAHKGEADSSCYGFPHNCSSSDAYLAASTKVFRFPSSRLSHGQITYSGFRSASATSGRVAPAVSMGSRATLSVTLADGIDNDNYLPYPERRSSNGTLWGKILARHPNMTGRKIEHYKGFDPLNFDIDNFISTEYVIDDVQRQNGNVTLFGVDPLMLAEESKSKLPLASDATLVAAIDDVSLAITYANDIALKYGAVGVTTYVRIDSEIIECTHASDFELTIINRASHGSEQQNHSVNSTVQECRWWVDENPVTVINELFTDGTSIESRFLDDYTAVISATSSKTVTRMLSKPTAISKLVNELIVVADLTLFFSDTEKLIKIKPVTDQDLQPLTFEEGVNIMSNTAKITRDTKNQYTRYPIAWAPYDATKATDEEDFSIRYLPINIGNEIPRNLGEVNEKDLFPCSWLTNAVGDTAKGTSIGQRLIDRNQDVPELGEFVIDAEDVGNTPNGTMELGSLVSLATSQSQHADGSFKSKLHQVLSIQQLKGTPHYRVNTRLFQDPETASAVDFTISENKINYDLSTEFAPVAGHYVILIEAGVVIGPTDVSIPAFDEGAQAAGVSFEIIVRGSILGAGGHGGNGGNLPTTEGFVEESIGQNGGTGGTAINITVPTTINAGGGEVWAGGGGVNGGTSYVIEIKAGVFSPVAGNGGSGGQGFIGGNGALTGNVTGFYTRTALDGVTGTQTAPGTLAGVSGGLFGEDSQRDTNSSSISSNAGLAGFAIISNGNAVTITSGNNSLNIKGRQS